MAACGGIAEIMVEERWTGRCNCGAVEYLVTGPIEPFWHCHCELCVRYHGHAGAYTRCEQQQISVDEDQGLTWWRQPDNEKRGFCRICGSSLFSIEADRPHIMFIAVGSLDDTGSHKITRHMCFNEKRPYYTVEDDLEKLDYHE